MGVIRDKMAEELRLRGMSEATAKAYLSNARRFVEFQGKSPLRVDQQDVRRYLLHRIDEEAVSTSTQAQCIASLKFLFEVTLRRPEVMADVAYPKCAQRLPAVLTAPEIERLLGCITSIRHRVICTLCYAAGLRISEARSLRVEDLDGKRGVIHVHAGKGRKDRCVPTGHKLLALLREYWKIGRPAAGYLFPGPNPERPVTPNAVCHALREAKRAARIRKHVTPHVLRHSYATHLLELGTDLATIRELLGHAHITTTMRYLHLVPARLSKVKSPFDMLGTDRHQPPATS